MSVGRCRVVATADGEVALLTLLKPSANVVQVFGLCVNAWDGRPRRVLEGGLASVRDYVRALPPEQVRAPATGRWHHRTL